MDLIAASSEFRDYIRGQKSGIASGNIDVQVFLIQESVKDKFKIFDQLDFIQKQIILSIIFYQGMNMSVESFRILMEPSV